MHLSRDVHPWVPVIISVLAAGGGIAALATLFGLPFSDPPKQRPQKIIRAEAVYIDHRKRLDEAESEDLKLKNKISLIQRLTAEMDVKKQGIEEQLPLVRNNLKALQQAWRREAPSMKQSISDKETELLPLQAREDKLNEKLKALKTKKIALNRDLRQINSQIANREKEKKKLETDKVRLDKMLHKQQQDHERLQVQLETLLADKSRLLQVEKVKQQAYNDLKIEVKREQTLLDDIQKNNTEWNNSIALLQQRKTVLEKDLSDLKIKQDSIDHLKSEKTHLEQQVAKLITKREKQRIPLKQLQLEISSLKVKQKKLSSEWQWADKTHNKLKVEISTARKTANDQEKMINKAKTDVAVLQKQKKDIEAQLAKQQELANRTIKASTLLEKGNATLTAKLNHLSQHAHGLEQRLVTLKDKEMTLKKHNKAIGTLVSKIQQAVTEKTQALADLEREQPALIKDRERLGKESDKKIQQLTRLKKQAESLLHDKKGAAARVKAARQSIDRKTETLAQLTKQKNKLTEQLHRLQKKSSTQQMQLETVRKEILTLSNTNKLIKVQLIASRKSIEAKTTNVTRLEKKKHKLIDDLLTTQENTDNLDKTTEKLKDGVSTLIHCRNFRKALLHTASKALPIMRQIPAGRYEIGCLTKNNCEENEGVGYQVVLQPYKIAKAEVTVAQYAAFLNGRRPGDTLRKKWVDTTVEDDKGNHLIENRGRYQAETRYTDYPITRVSYWGAQAYVEWLAETFDKDYHLPSEAQWEVAARGHKSTSKDAPSKFWWGNQEPICLKGARNGATFSDCLSSDSKPIGSYQSNPFKLVDMHGNVKEWTCSLYHNPYNKGSTTCLSPDRIRANDGYRMVRGGSWRSSASELRAAVRDFYTPSNRFADVGFRIAEN